MASDHTVLVVVFISIMVIIFGIGLFLVPILGAPEIEHSEKCPFRDTVDLTNHTRLQNGSYLYDGILIAADQLSYYKYRLQFLNTTQPAELHLRGCICDNSKNRFCTKLCCERGKFFNQTSRRCETLANTSGVPEEMEILLKNKSHKTWNIFKHFVIQIGAPCEKPQVLSMTDDPWILFENGELWVETDYTKLDTVHYCISPQYNGTSKKLELMAMSCPMKNDPDSSMVFNTYSMLISVVFFIPTILIHLAVKELRDSLTGKLQTCYLIALVAGYSIIVFINILPERWPEPTCQAIGFSGYYFFMSAYFWLGVLCYDMWKTFGEYRKPVDSSREIMNRFIIYSAFVWGTAGVLTLIVIWAQLNKVVPKIYKPGIGLEMCWLDTRKWSAALYFYLPNCIIMLFNIAAFVQVSTVIYTVKRNALKYKTNQDKAAKRQVIIILRLFLIMGISWIMDIISYCFRNYKSLDFLFNVTDFCNASQGVLIFFLFIFRRDVLKAIKQQFGTRKKTTVNKSNEMVLTIQSQLSKTSTIPRTPSTPHDSAPLP
ncbi:G-protein coupled receptor Mth2 [Musca domestica]|uniref:G-protein coupled receptor Mth2 n=1 Tax=Musca domestica TaxID=7370 RepID=A0A9J7I5I3_MUSDO|nr:G-protein coupled receptor Mth2 [Musca domestica]